MELKELFRRYQLAMSTVYRGINNILKEKIHLDITTDQFAILQYIHNHDQCTSTKIAHSFGVGKSAVTAQINRLHEKGLIKRKRDDKDRRNIYLYVSQEGVNLVSYTEKELYSVIGKHLSYFDSNEVQSFVKALEQLAHMLENEQ